MPQTIYKYQLLGVAGEPIKVAMPSGAKILSCQIQEGLICLWAVVDPHATPVNRTFNILGTGWAVRMMPEGRKLEFIATVQEGHYVWHIFEET